MPCSVTGLWPSAAGMNFDYGQPGGARCCELAGSRTLVVQLPFLTSYGAGEFRLRTRQVRPITRTPLIHTSQMARERTLPALVRHRPCPAG